MKTLFSSLFIFLVVFALGQKVDLFVPYYSKPIYNNDSSYAITNNNKQIEIWSVKRNQLLNVINTKNCYQKECQYSIPSFTNKGDKFYFSSSDSVLFFYSAEPFQKIVEIKLPFVLYNTYPAAYLSKNDRYLFANNNNFVYKETPKTIIIDMLKGTIIDSFPYLFECNEICPKLFYLYGRGEDNYQYVNYLYDIEQRKITSNNYGSFPQDSTYLICGSSKNYLTIKSLTVKQKESIKYFNLKKERDWQWKSWHSDSTIFELTLHQANTGKVIGKQQAAFFKDIYYVSPKNYNESRLEKDARFILLRDTNGIATLWDIKQNKIYPFKLNVLNTEFYEKEVLSDINNKFLLSNDLDLSYLDSTCLVFNNCDNISANVNESKRYKNYLVVVLGYSWEKQKTEIYDCYNNKKICTINDEHFIGYEDEKHKAKNFFQTTEGKKISKDSSLIKTKIYEVATGKVVFSLLGSNQAELITDSLVNIKLSKDSAYIYNFLNKEIVAKYILHYEERDEYNKKSYLNIISSKISIDILIQLLFPENNTTDVFNKNFYIDIFYQNKKQNNSENKSWLNKCRYSLDGTPNGGNGNSFISKGKNFCCNTIDRKYLVMWDINRGYIKHFYKSFFMHGTYGSGFSNQLPYPNEIRLCYAVGNHSSGCRIYYVSTDSLIFQNEQGRYYGGYGYCNGRDCNFKSYDGKYLFKNINDTTNTIINIQSNKTVKVYNNKSSKNHPFYTVQYVDFKFHNKPDLFSYNNNNKYYLINLKTNQTLFTLLDSPQFIDTSNYFYIKKGTKTFSDQRWSKETERLPTNFLGYSIKSLSNSKWSFDYCFLDTFVSHQFEIDDKNNIKLICLDSNNNITITDVLSKKLDSKTSIKKNILVNQLSYKSNLFTSIENNYIKFYQLSTGKPLYTYIPLDENNFIVYDEEGHYDASENALQYVYYSCGNRVVPASKTNYKSRVVGLVQKIMSNQKHLITAPTKEDLNICNLVE